MHLPITAVCRSLGATGLWRSPTAVGASNRIADTLSPSPYRVARFDSNGFSGWGATPAYIFPLLSHTAPALPSLINGVALNATGTRSAGSGFALPTGPLGSVLFGSNGYASTTATFPTIDGTHSATVGIMVKLNAGTQDGGCVLAVRGLISQQFLQITVHHDGAGFYPRVTWGLDATNDSVDNSTHNTFHGDNYLDDGNWHHLAAVLTVGGVSLFHNGQKVGEYVGLVALSDILLQGRWFVGARPTTASVELHANADLGWAFVVGTAMSRRWIADFHRSLTRCSDLRLVGDVFTTPTSNPWDRQAVGLSHTGDFNTTTVSMGIEEHGSFADDIVFGVGGFTVMADIKSLREGATGDESLFDMFASTNAANPGGGPGSLGSHYSYGAVFVRFTGSTASLMVAWSRLDAGGSWSLVYASVPLPAKKGHVIAVFPDGTTRMTIYLNGKKVYEDAGSLSLNPVGRQADITPEWRGEQQQDANSGALSLLPFTGTTGVLSFIPRCLSSSEANRLFRTARGSYGQRHRFALFLPRRYYQKASPLRVK